MPSVPLLQPHGVVVQFLIEVLKQRDSLDNHSVYLVRREGECVAGHGMSQTQLHGLELFGVIKTLNERLHLETNAAHELVNFLSGFAGNSELLRNDFAEFLLSDEELIFNLLF